MPVSYTHLDVYKRQAPGRSAEYVRSAQVITWKDAAARISQLMDNGAYASNVELAEAGQHERMQLAQALWYLKHDLSAVSYTHLADA